MALPNTSNYSWPRPDKTGLQRAEIDKIDQAIVAADAQTKTIDVLLAALITSFNGHTHSFNNITGKPSTLAGYGITDSYTKAAADTAIANAIAALVASSPAALDTLNELATALGNDPNFATTMTNALGQKLNASTYTAADILAKLKTVDGVGSGLDADLLDGKTSAEFVSTDAIQTIAAAKTFSAGISFGNTAATLQSDMTKHIALFGSTYGFSVTGGTLNYNSNGSHKFRIGDADIVNITTTTFTFNGNAVSLAKDVYTKAEVYAKAETYTKAEVDSGLGGRIIRDSITHAGFASNNAANPYFRKADDNIVYYLQRSLGFTPVRQGGQSGMGSNTVYLGWSGSRILINVDGYPQGGAMTTSLFPNDLGVQLRDGGVGGIIYCVTQSGVSVGRSITVIGTSLNPAQAGAWVNIGVTGNVSTPTLYVRYV
ncbi:hypothetical protein [Mesorhizobium sp. NBSH29]|uniref:hypothetical protein n=1 Tax=Mesorhizobium sp. NBSH29 TaxID=2654249 RepID=UPI001AED20C5|nr:hypothetical protein [Mesorhizobium sp. NBSH29]